MGSVRVEGVDLGKEVLVEARRHEEYGTWIVIPNTVLWAGEDQQLQVRNLGRKPWCGRRTISWRGHSNVSLVERIR